MKRTLLAFVLMLSSVALLAQQSEDYRIYAADNGATMLLLRGRQGMDFPLRHNGTHFWYTPDFVPGTLYYNSKLYENVLLNVDAFNQELLIRDPRGITNILLSRDYVEWFEMGGSKYMNLRAMGYEDAPEGYFQVLYDGKAKFLFRIDKTLERDVDGRMWASAGWQGNLHAGVFDIFVERRSYYYIAEGSKDVTRVSGRKSLLREYKSRKKEIRRHMSGIGNYRNMDFGNYAVEVLKYVEGR